jgi:hypothetical protein
VIAVPPEVIQPALIRVAADKEPLLYVVEHPVRECVEGVLLEKVETETVDRADIQICQTLPRTHCFFVAKCNAVLQLGRGPLVEGERDDVVGRNAREP